MIRAKLTYVSAHGSVYFSMSWGATAERIATQGSYSTPHFQFHVVREQWPVIGLRVGLPVPTSHKMQRRMNHEVDSYSRELHFHFSCGLWQPAFRAHNIPNDS